MPRQYTTAECFNLECDEIWYGVQTKKWLTQSDEDSMCTTCGSPMYITGDSSEMNGLAMWPENGITLEHAEAKPVHLKSRQAARDYAKKNNVQLGCL